MKYGLIFGCLVGLLAVSCRQQTVSEEGLLAKVYDKTLYLSEVRKQMPRGLSPEDSLVFVKEYTDGWIRESVMLHRAEQELPNEALDVQNRLEHYRRSLLIYAYEKEYAQQKLDTTVSETEIETHYQENQEDFKLADYIVKVLYIKLDKNDRQKEKVARWYKSTVKADRVELEKYCAENAVNYYNDSESWVYLNELLREVPLRLDDKQAFLEQQKSAQFEDEEFAYYLWIYDYRLKDSFSPLSLERENIKARILNLRTTELIKQMRIELLKSASAEIKNYVEN